MSRAVTLAGYALLVAAAVGLELMARRRGRGTTFAGAVALARRPWPGRALLLASWLWLGWHLFVRSHWQ